MGIDLAGDGKRFIYLAESAARASLYATRDFAGGEFRRAFRYAFEDLGEFLNIPHLQDACRTEWLAADLRRTPEQWQFNPEIILSHLEALRPSYLACADTLAAFQGGIIYAVSLGPKHLNQFKYSGSMGVKTAFHIEAKHIVASLLVPNHYEWTLQPDERRLNFKWPPSGPPDEPRGEDFAYDQPCPRGRLSFAHGTQFRARSAVGNLA